MGRRRDLWGSTAQPEHNLNPDLFGGHSVLFGGERFNQIYFVTQNYTITIKNGKIKQCVNRTQRQLRAALTGVQKDIYGKSFTGLWLLSSNILS